jgi:hypothetical protein
MLESNSPPKGASSSYPVLWNALKTACSAIRHLKKRGAVQRHAKWRLPPGLSFQAAPPGRHHSPPEPLAESGMRSQRPFSRVACRCGAAGSLLFSPSRSPALVASSLVGLRVRIRLAPGESQLRGQLARPPDITSFAAEPSQQRKPWPRRVSPPIPPCAVLRPGGRGPRAETTGRGCAHTS